MAPTTTIPSRMHRPTPRPTTVLGAMCFAFDAGELKGVIGRSSGDSERGREDVGPGVRVEFSCTGDTSVVEVSLACAGEVVGIKISRTFEDAVCMSSNVEADVARGENGVLVFRAELGAFGGFVGVGVTYSVRSTVFVGGIRFTVDTKTCCTVETTTCVESGMGDCLLDVGTLVSSAHRVNTLLPKQQSSSSGYGQQ